MNDFQEGDRVYYLADRIDGLTIEYGMIEPDEYKTVFKISLIDGLGYTHARKIDCFRTKEECQVAFDNWLDRL